MIAALTWLANVFHPIKLYKPIYIKKACANTNTTQANTWRDFSITTTAVNVWFILLISSSRDTSISCFFFFFAKRLTVAYGGIHFRWRLINAIPEHLIKKQLVTFCPQEENVIPIKNIAIFHMIVMPYTVLCKWVYLLTLKITGINRFECVAFHRNSWRN